MNKSNFQYGKVRESIEKGIGFLAEHQFASGEFVTYFSADEEMKEWCATDSTTFMTALIGQCLEPFAARPDVDNILTKAQWFLKAQGMYGGAFHFFAKHLTLFNTVPLDIDSTVTTGLFLRSRNIGFPDATPIVLSNRNKDGLFYTWFSPRFSFSKNKTVWKVRLRSLKNPLAAIFARLNNEFTHNDLDFIVNINVLLFLGDVPATRPVVSYINEIIKNNKELSSDNWYHNPFVIYHSCSRLFRLNISDLEGCRAIIAERLHKIIKPNEMRPLEIAFAISAMINIGIVDPVIEELSQKLLASQNVNGSWDRLFFYTVPSQKIGWGCEELTTGYAIDALGKYLQFIDQKQDAA